MEYYTSQIENLTDDLKYKFQNAKGQDVSDLIRGGIQAYEDVINMERSLKGYLDKKEQLKKAEEASKGAKQ